MRRLIQYNAPTTLTFALLSFLALGLGARTDGASTLKYFCVYRAALDDPLTYLRFFTHVLGHSGYAHFAGNMMLLLVLGPGLEERYGSATILWCILATAFLSGLIQFLFFPATALLGASGIVFMMILMASLSGSRGRGVPLTLVLVFLLYIGREVVDGMTAADNVSHLTHIVGGLCGTVLGSALRRRG